MRTGLTISTVAHAVVLALALVTLSFRALEPVPPEPISIDIVSASELSQLSAGHRNAPKRETPKPLVEKVAVAKPPESSATKVVEKPEVIPTAAPAPTPPEPKVPEPKRVAPPSPPEAKVEPKPQEPEKKEPKPDPIAEALKLDEVKKPEPKKVEAKKPEQKKPEPVKPPPKFDADRIAALLDKREPQRVQTPGATTNPTPALGAPTGNAAQLSQSEIAAFREKLKLCWNPPVGAPNADRIKVPITIRLKLDRSLAAAPQVGVTARDAFVQATIDSAVRAIVQCQPYTMFSLSKYETWKELDIDFDPAEMFGG